MSGHEIGPGSEEPTIGRTGVGLGTIVVQWLRLGSIGFGGPPSHIALLRKLCVAERRWIEAHEFESALTTTNLLPGPASTQLAIYCGWRLRGRLGGVLAGVCFIVPGLALILGLAAVFLAGHPSRLALGAAAGASAALPAVALNAARGLVPPSWRRIGSAPAEHLRWVLYAIGGVAAAAFAGPYLVLALVLCGGIEIGLSRRGPIRGVEARMNFLPLLAIAGLAAGGIGALAWEAFKVGALSYGGGFVIIPLMQHDAVSTYHWMSAPQFLDAVALGQLTPGPVVQTVAVVGYAAGGPLGGVFAALVAFTPSFVFVLLGAPHFDAIRENRQVEAFLTGAGPAVIGAIAGSAITLGAALGDPRQVVILFASAIWLFALRRDGVVSCLLAAATAGTILTLAGVKL